jgi:hypothetical protein
VQSRRTKSVTGRAEGSAFAPAWMASKVSFSNAII